MIMRPLFIAAIVALVAVPLSAQIKAPELADAPAKTARGLTLTFTARDKTDSRTARLVALYVPAGQPVTPFLAPGPFGARWEGSINSPLRAEYTFDAEVKGSFKLTINDKPVLEGAGDTTSQEVNKVFQLNKGENKFVAEFASDGTLDALLRLNWWSEEFPAEPVPPSVFTHDANAKLLRAGMRVRKGRMLFAELRCIACHAAPDLIPLRGEAMSELAQDAPLFDDVGGRFNEAWLAHWISDPHGIRPRSRMPRLFRSAPGEVEQRAADLAAYFVSLSKRDDTVPARENASLGGALFANLGCIACHTVPDSLAADDKGRVPLSHVKAKWQPHALRDYLKDPARNYKWTHMPNFRLTEEESERITSYLLGGKQREFPAGPRGDPAKGAQLLVTAGCLNCHAGMPPTTQPTLAATLKRGWTTGCLANDAATRGNAPDFNFNETDRDALRSFAASGFDSLKRDTPIEFAERQMNNLRCAACHARDGESSIWSTVEAEMTPLQAAAPTQPEAVEGAPISAVGAPMSTWFGEKLRPDWMEQFINGKIPDKPRPWLIARMPGFATVAKGLAEGFSHEHGFGTAIEPETAVDQKSAKAGEILLGANGGFNCVTCHAVGDQPATAVFEAPGINFAFATDRLRHGYYQRWVLHPLRVDPESKMPKFADEEGKTPLTDFFAGDARQQFEAIWQFLRTLKK